MNLSKKSATFWDRALTLLHLSFALFRAKRKARSSKRQNLACAGHDNFCRMALHRRDEVACVGIEKIEGPVVAGDNGIEFEETLDRERRRPPAHGETVADRHKADLGRMNLRDQTHVGEHFGIAHVIKARRVPWLDDNAVRTAEIDGLAVDDGSRRMQRLGEAHAECAAIDRAPGVAGVDIFRALRVHIHADFEIRNDLRAGRLGDLGGVADMIVMAVGEQNVGCPCRRLCDVAGEFRVAAEKWVDQNNRRAKLDAESRVAEPNQVHWGPHPKRARSGRRRAYPRTPNYTRNIYMGDRKR